jgi:uncharacterized membrane protein
MDLIYLFIICGLLMCIPLTFLVVVIITSIELFIDWIKANKT